MMPAAVVIAGVAAVAFLPQVLAQAPPPPPPRLTGNVTLVGDCRFRGVSQTYTQPAIQGGAEYALPAGAYAGSWASNVSGNQFLHGGSLELDLYGGYRWTAGNRGLDVGVYYYWYLRARYNISPGDRYNTTELYVGAHYQQFSAKYSHAVTNLFGMKTSTVGGFCGITSDGTAGSSNCLGTGSSKCSGYVDCGLPARADAAVRRRDVGRGSSGHGRAAAVLPVYADDGRIAGDAGRRQARRRSLGKQSILRSSS